MLERRAREKEMEAKRQKRKEEQLVLEEQLAMEEQLALEEQLAIEEQEAKLSSLASSLDMTYQSEVGSKKDAKRGAKQVIKSMKTYYSEKKKSPYNEEAKAAWDLVTEQFPHCVVAIREFLSPMRGIAAGLIRTR